MKKVFSLLLTAALLFSLSACSNQPKPPEGMLDGSAEIVFSSDDAAPPEGELERPGADETVGPSTGAEEPPASSISPEKPEPSGSQPQSRPASSSEAQTSAPASSSQAGSSEEAPEPSVSSRPTASSEREEPEGSAPRGELRAVWISYLDFNTLLKNQTEAAFTRAIDRQFAQLAEDGFNTVFVQVRPFGDALYPSEYFPWSHTITGEEGRDPGFDPLEILIDSARANGLEIEAWINPYRIRNSGTKAALDKGSIAYGWYADGGEEVIEYGGGLYFNPASEAARALIVDGVVEIVEHYDVDGIHFDDYFYPTTDAAFDADSYAAYKADGGNLSLAGWRRANVDELVREVYAAIKRTDPGVRFGISPQGNDERNYNEQYIDVAKWLKNPGYVDYICPQIYYGFQNTTCPYADTVAYWDRLVKREDIDLYIGLSASKIGLEDKWAGEGKSEWQTSHDLLARMVAEARGLSKYDGFAVFRLNSLYRPEAAVKDAVEREHDALVDILD